MDLLSIMVTAISLCSAQSESCHEAIEQVANVVVLTQSVCVEAGSRRREGRLVLEVAMNRATYQNRAPWEVFDSSWNQNMPRWCAHTRPHHLKTALKALRGPRMPSMRGVRWFFTHRVAQRVEERWKAKGYTPALATRGHLYWKKG